MRLSARWILPVSSPPLENGTLVIEEGEIQGLEKASPRDQIEDLILLPGFVNSHCHLEHSALKDRTTDHLTYVEWVKEVTSERSFLTKEDIFAAARRAVPLLISGGSTTVADHCSPQFEFIETPFRRILFWEVLGASLKRSEESLIAARERERKFGGFITPHSLYAVHEEVLEEMFPLRSIHILESDDEDLFFRRQTGPLAVYIQERGGDLSFPVSSPIKWLRSVGALRDTPLLVHCNYLNDEEIEILRASEATVIHCPGSHRFFGYRRFPLEELKKRGIRIALGTDSLASNDDLSMLSEMKILKENYPTLSPQEILEMATLDGAKALKMEREIGSLEVGKKADIVGVTLRKRSRDPWEDIFQAEKVSFVMMDGKVL